MDPGGAGFPPVGAINDYPKFGAWHDCLYMSANEFTNLAGGGTYAGTSVASLSRADLYNGNPLTWALGYLNATTNTFSLQPAHSAGHGPTAVHPSTPGWFVESNFPEKHSTLTSSAGPNCGGGGTLRRYHCRSAYNRTEYGEVVPQPNTVTNFLDNRRHAKVQYRQGRGRRSLWVVHTIPLATNQAALQWAQLNVTGGSVAAAAVQQQVYSPDTTLFRFMPSIAADNQGNVAIGFSASVRPFNLTIKYVGRLAGDPLNTLPEPRSRSWPSSVRRRLRGQSMRRWGDYSAMSIDPSTTAFWYNRLLRP